MIRFILLFSLIFSMNSFADESIPTYPKWSNGIYPGVLTTTIEIFNKRKDVEYYDIGVFDKDWNPVYFVAEYKVIRLTYLSRTSIDIFIAKENREKVEYVCSRSKIRKEQSSRPAVSSKICSRFKQ